MLGHELTGKRSLQDGLAEGIGASEVGVDFPIQQFGCLKAAPENPDDFSLFR